MTVGSGYAVSGLTTNMACQMTARRDWGPPFSKPLAMSWDSDWGQNLLEELASDELAEREFRSWDQWRKSAGRTMSPGLLAMSIGAPKTLAFNDVLANTSDPAIR